MDVSSLFTLWVHSDKRYIVCFVFFSGHHVDVLFPPAGAISAAVLVQAECLSIILCVLLHLSAVVLYTCSFV